MTERERNITDMFVATTAFDDVNAGDYVLLPDAAAHFTIVRQVIANLNRHFAARTSGASGQAVEIKAVVRAAIRRKMLRYSKTARALNLDDPGFRRLFSVPEDNDQELLASAREFVIEARRFPRQFTGRGIPATLADELETDIAALESAISAKAAGRSNTAGASAGIDEEIERGMKAEKILDSIMHNIYFDNPTKLAQWMTARHVRKSSRSPAPPTPPVA